MSEVSKFEFIIPKSNTPIKRYNKESDFVQFTNNLVIIGSNGAGKSKLGFWIANNIYSYYNNKKLISNFLGSVEASAYNFQKHIHRISANRNLNFSDNIRVETIESAERNLFNSDKINTDPNNMLSDFNQVFSFLQAQQFLVYEKFVKKNDEEIYPKKENAIHSPPTPISKLINIWNDIFPHLAIEINEGKIIAKSSTSSKSFTGSRMSDGERSALYLLGRILSIPDNSFIIIDEPNNHFHPRIKNTLWDSLEKAFADSIFIYITHDLEFAKNRYNSELIWVKSYVLDENNRHIWEWEKIPSDVPIKLLENLGINKKILFIEGKKELSLDHNIFSHLYPEFHLVPCESSQKVIENTKAFSSHHDLHNNLICGIIDRDYKSNGYLDDLKNHNIFSLQVAEIENLFWTPELLQVVANNQRFGDNFEEILEKIKEIVFKERFSKEINIQIKNYATHRIRYELEKFSSGAEEITQFSQDFDDHIKKIDYKKYYEDAEILFKDILEKKDFSKCLLYFNSKNISNSIAKVFELTPKGYSNLVLRLLDDPETSDTIKNAFKNYIPQLP